MGFENLTLLGFENLDTFSDRLAVPEGEFDRGMVRREERAGAGLRSVECLAMRGVVPAVAEPTVRVDRPPKKRRWTPVSALGFAGCDAIRMTLAAYEALGDDDKVEFFDSAAGLAWRVQEPVAFAARRTGTAAGGGFGTHRHDARVADPVLSARAGCGCWMRKTGQVRAIHPDEMVFLHPESGDTRNGSFLTVGEDAYPDVVLEVDNTRDTRRDKLALYEEWGFPELWVEVPNAWSPSRPRGLRPELRIYLPEGERYVLSPESRAFGGLAGRGDPPRAERTGDFGG